MSKWKIFKRGWAPATGKHWQVLDSHGQCVKVFYTFEEALDYADKKSRTIEVVVPRAVLAQVMCGGSLAR